MNLEPARPLVRILRLVLSRAAAEAAIGDVIEELAARHRLGRS